MNNNIYEQIKNNGSMVPEYYEPTWDKYIRKNIIKHTSKITAAVKLAKSYEDLYNIFAGGGLTHTYSVYIRRILRPNSYMKACLQFIADMGATSPKYIIELYHDEIKNFNKARLYEAINILAAIDLIRPEILPYVTPKPVTVWAGEFCTIEQLATAIDKYEADRIKAEQKEKKKELVITHNYNKAPEKEKSKTWAEVNDKKEKKDTRVYCSDHGTYHHCEKSKGGIK